MKKKGNRWIESFTCPRIKRGRMGESILWKERRPRVAFGGSGGISNVDRGGVKGERTQERPREQTIQAATDPCGSNVA